MMLMSDAHHEIFTRLFAETREALRRYVRRFVGSRDMADEIVQEAFLRTYEHRESLRTPKAFLFTTARNLAWSARRHKRVAATDSVGDFDDSGVTNQYRPKGDRPLEDGLIADEASRLLKEAVDRLSPQCRAAFALKVFHACSYREIAAKLNVTEGTVEKHIAHGLRETHAYLRQRYSEDRIEHDGSERAAGQPHMESGKDHG